MTASWVKYYIYYVISSCGRVPPAQASTAFLVGVLLASSLLMPPFAWRVGLFLAGR
jgi:hypothetical protein